ncbi:MAG: hypothetical protein A3F67_04765 [Verrucomicrobia bacterium RIFCSPHIGHO2_12_FULL_41_10]|nr:MAG: hypothetical protein A3F67_04765 [Verrucomicrobia bacterium RIFCSPHIGHO2_12_FULL_41_10]
MITFYFDKYIKKFDLFKNLDLKIKIIIQSNLFIGRVFIVTIYLGKNIQTQPTGFVFYLSLDI